MNIKKVQIREMSSQTLCFIIEDFYLFIGVSLAIFKIKIIW